MSEQPTWLDAEGRVVCARCGQRRGYSWDRESGEPICGWCQDASIQAADDVYRTPVRRVERGGWRTRTDHPPEIISVYVDLNTEGLFLGGGFWRFEGYLHLRFRLPASSSTTESGGE